MAWKKSLDKSVIHPALVRVTELTLEKLKEWGVPFKVYSGLRTFEQQNKLYAKGRTASGNIVTNARGGQSMHNYGLAEDLAPFNMVTDNPDDLHWPDPDKDDNVWFKLEQALFESAQEIDVGDDWDGIDFEWGGRWKFRDVPHIQVRTTLGELSSGHYPYCRDIEWLVVAHSTFLFDTPWMHRRVQYLLNMQSYDAGVVDGIMGNRTLTALQNFSKDQEIVKSISWTMDGKRVLERLLRLNQTGMSTERGTLPEDLVG